MRVERYDVTLTVDPVSFEFSGRVEITGAGFDPELELSAADLTLTASAVDGHPLTWEAGSAAGTIRSRAIPPESRRLEFEFRGRAPERALVGPYQSRAGAGRMWTTMMYPTGCGRLFPCVDHPAAKAVFALTVTTSSSVEVISNTPAVEREVVGDRVRWRFADTPKMSTYLLYLGIGPLEKVERLEDGRRLAVWAPIGRSESGRFALDRLGPYLKAFEEYYEIPYPLPKLDLVSVLDFWAGGMENWGAITFAETRLLVDPSTPIAARRSVEETVAHEVAHQWFGDLVTNEWWDDFWLNESFATFAGHSVLDRLDPARETWSEFLNLETAGGLDADSLEVTHPIEVPIQRPEEIGQIADRISYGKGASVLRMIEGYVGADGFRRGVTAYLRRYAYSNARGKDLWTALEEANGGDVARVMAAWVARPGYPVVDVHRSNGEVRLTQSRFSLVGPPATELPWPIPLTVDLEGARQRRLFETRELVLPNPSNAPVRVDPDRTAFLRIRYEPAELKSLVGSFPSLSVTERWGLIRDEAAFVRSGDRPLSTFLSVVRAAAQVSDYATTGAAVGEMLRFRPTLGDLEPFAEAGRSYSTTVLDRMGASPTRGEPETTSMVRGLVASLAVRFDERSAQRWAEAYRTVERLAPELRSAAISAYAREGGRSAVDELIREIERAPTDEKAQELAAGVGSATSPDAARAALDFAERPDLPWHRSFAVIGGLARAPENRPLLWPWLESNLRRIEASTKGTPVLSLFVPFWIPDSGVDRQRDIERYFERESFPEASKGIARGLEFLRIAQSVRDAARSAGGLGGGLD